MTTEYTRPRAPSSVVAPHERPSLLDMPAFEPGVYNRFEASPLTTSPLTTTSAEGFFSEVCADPDSPIDPGQRRRRSTNVHGLPPDLSSL